MDKSGWWAPLGQATWERKSERKKKRTVEKCQECVCVDIAQSSPTSLKSLVTITWQATPLKSSSINRPTTLWGEKMMHLWQRQHKTASRKRTRLVKITWLIVAQTKKNRTVRQFHFIPFVYPQECNSFAVISQHGDQTLRGTPSAVEGYRPCLRHFWDLNLPHNLSVTSNHWGPPAPTIIPFSNDILNTSAEWVAYADTHASVRCLPRHHPTARRRPDRHRMRWYLQEHRQNCNLPAFSRSLQLYIHAILLQLLQHIKEQFGNVSISMIVTTNQLLHKRLAIQKGVWMLFVLHM